MTPEIREQLVSSFSPTEVQTAEQLLNCMQGAVTSAKFRRLIMLLLRGHYSSADNYGDEYSHLACYTYAPSGNGSLEVGYTQQNDNTRPDKFPGVYVEFGGVQLDRVSLGDFAGMSDDMARNNLSRQATLTLIVHHVTQKAADSYDMADMSAMVLTAMATPMALKSGASSFEVLGYNTPKKEQEAPTRYYDVAMTVKIAYTQAVTRSVESHRIRRIAMVITAE